MKFRGVGDILTWTVRAARLCALERLEAMVLIEELCQEPVHATEESLFCGFRGGICLLMEGGCRAPTVYERVTYGKISASSTHLAYDSPFIYQGKGTALLR